MNLKQIEKLLIEHLQESGEIRADLKWLKRSFWTLAGGGMTFNIAVICYLLWGAK
jgi:hypothetical protein